MLAANGTITKAAESLGISRHAFARRLRGVMPSDPVKLAAEKGAMGFAPVLPGFSIKSTAAKVGDAWVKQTKEHGETFETPEGHEIKAVSALVDAEGRIIHQWVKTCEGDNSSLLVDAIKGAFDEYKGRAEFVSPPSDGNANLLTAYVIGDHHLGLLAWGPETGESSDLKIGERLLLDKMRALVDCTPAADTALVMNLGDFFHADDDQNRTAKSGHALDVDGRYAKVLRVGVALTIACIDMALEKHARVIYRALSGNHDPHTSLALTVALSMFYNSNPRVEIDCDPSKHFVHRHGETLIFASHGDALRPERVAGFVASRWPKLWGATTHRVAMFGHVHHSAKGGEADGMTWETFQTLSAKDAWHAGQGYSSGRSMSAITYHSASGELLRNRVSV